MTDYVLQNVIHRLESAAHCASVAEENYRRDAIRQIASLERERSFAFRRLNFVKSLVATITDAEDHAAAMTHATSAFLREVNWNGASESQREVVERFLPVADAVWQSRAGDETERDNAETVIRELASFEQWFEANRNAAFLTLMDGEVLELPLVEV